MNEYDILTPIKILNINNKTTCEKIYLDTWKKNNLNLIFSPYFLLELSRSFYNIMLARLGVLRFIALPDVTLITLRNGETKTAVS